jgi:GNAT superfamily N-acetyltransferase
MSIRIRAAVPGEGARLARVGRTAYPDAFHGLVPEQCFKPLPEEESAANWERALREASRDGDPIVLVAEDEGGPLVGFAVAVHRPDEPIYRAEVTNMLVETAYQRQGIGRRLVQAAARRLAESGVRSLLIRCLTINPNRPFYERLGGKPLRVEPYDWEGFACEEVVYGWEDTTPLLEA